MGRPLKSSELKRGAHLHVRMPQAVIDDFDASIAQYSPGLTRTEAVQQALELWANSQRNATKKAR
jgi:hypothetical protein